MRMTMIWAELLIGKQLVHVLLIMQIYTQSGSCHANEFYLISELFLAEIKHKLFIKKSDKVLKVPTSNC